MRHPARLLHAACRIRSNSLHPALRLAAAAPDREQPDGAVFAHAGEQTGDSLRSAFARDGLEQLVNRGTAQMAFGGVGHTQATPPTSR